MRTWVPGTRTRRTRTLRAMALAALGALLLAPLLAAGGEAAIATTSSGATSGTVLTSAHTVPDAVAKKKKKKPAKKKAVKKKTKKKKKKVPAPAPVSYVMGAATRKQEAPNVTYPLPSTSKPADTKTFSTSNPGTEIRAACGTEVRSIHPGSVHIVDVAPWGGGTALVEVTTSEGRLTSWYGYMSNIGVTEGQIVSSGQPLGTAGSLGGTICGIHLEIHNGTQVLNPTSWLETYVGKPTPDLFIFGSYGFTLASFNQLGASHTAAHGDNRKYPGYATRTPKAVAYLKSHSIEVAGLQEFQKKQYNMFRSLAPEYDVATAGSDTENAIVWRKDAFDLVEAHTFVIPYFNGHGRAMPYVLLRQKSTGRTAWFINVHNPANTKKYKKQGGWRAQAIAIERQLVISLRAQDRPVFLTGDLNDRTAAYCPLAQGKLMLSADTVPSIDCQPPAQPWIDWVLAAGQARFGTYYRDYSTRTAKITDHPIVYAQAFLAE
ncbi:MAG: Endonuclease/Exonuclease/phosphatase family protein [Nocardioidaceae bacterium]|nr:Endonuclease/Exonuclease/phosphatase family protein [Nocardioidaceae bacterium]